MKSILESSSFILFVKFIKMKKSKKIELFKKIYYENEDRIIDKSLDWLRYKFELNQRVVDVFENFQENSSLWNQKLVWKWTLTFWKWSLWETIMVSQSIQVGSFQKSINIARIQKIQDRKNMKDCVLVDFYWSFFVLYDDEDINKEVREEILKMFWLYWKMFSITRADFQITIKEKKEIFEQKYISKLEKEKKVNYKGESWTYCLYKKKWRQDWKVKYWLTDDMWFRFYDKKQNIEDLGMERIWKYEMYMQYNNLFRVEVVLWTKTIWKKGFIDFYDADAFIVDKLFWWVNLYEKAEYKKKEQEFNDKYAIWRKAVETKTKWLWDRFINYLYNGGEIEYLFDYVRDKDEWVKEYLREKNLNFDYDDYFI